MAYSARTDLEVAAGGPDRLVELCDRAGTGELDAAAVAVMNAAIVEADGLIDSYCQKKHAVPFATVPDAIRTRAAREAVYVLKCQRNVNSQWDDDRHAELLRWLELVARGSVSVGLDPVPTKSTEVVAEVLEPEDGEVTRDAFSRSFL